MTNILSEEISGLGDGCVEGVVDGEDLGKVGGDGDPRRGHEEHLVIQIGVLCPRTDLGRDGDGADRRPRTEEPHWARHTASIETVDGQREAACHPLVPVIHGLDWAAHPVVARHVLIALLHLDVLVSPDPRTQLELVHHVDGVQARDHLVEVPKVGRIIQLDTEERVERRVPE